MHFLALFLPPMLTNVVLSAGINAFQKINAKVPLPHMASRERVGALTRKEGSRVQWL